MQAVEAALEDAKALRPQFHARLGGAFEHRLHRMGEFAHRHHAAHPRAALERVQVALQSDHQLALRGRAAQTRQQPVGMIEDVGGFFDEDIQQFRIDIAHIQRLVWIRIDTGGENVTRLRSGGRLGLVRPRTHRQDAR